jgi:hypothetical protein
MAEEKTAIVTREQVARITTLEDLLSFFKVDTDQYEVTNFRVNKWEQASGNEETGITITPLYQIRATLEKRRPELISALEQIRADILADMDAHIGPTYPWPPEDGHPFMVRENSVLFEVAVMDPHIGMLAWKEEVGESYDLDRAVEDYVKANQYLLSLAKRNYHVNRVLLVLGNDMLHIDGMVDGKIGTTTAGTPQDFDSRLPKLFRAARRCAVSAIDIARLIAPVDVMVVPGNHDEYTMFKLGEVLAAWYREDPHVNVLNDPTRRKYYKYGRNGFLFTHGLEAKREREPLPLIFATEAPELWAATEHREIHCGHLHARMQREYMSPVDTVGESRSIITRVLPALTPLDAWHFNEGYGHIRAATGLAYDFAGGLVGLHEYYPKRGRA